MFAIRFDAPVPLKQSPTPLPPEALAGQCEYQNPASRHLLASTDIQQATKELLPQIVDKLSAQPIPSSDVPARGFESSLTINDGYYIAQVTPLVQTNTLIGYWSSINLKQLDADEQHSLRRLDAFINTENDPLVCLQFSSPLPRMVDGDSLAKAYLDARITRISAPAAQLVGAALPSLLQCTLRDLGNSQIEALLQNSFPADTRSTPLDLAITTELLVELPVPLNGVFRLKPTFVPGAGGYTEVWLRITDITADELQAHLQLKLNQTRELALRAASLYQFEIDFSTSCVTADEAGLRAMGLEEIPKDLKAWSALVQNHPTTDFDIAFDDAFRTRSEPLNTVLKFRNAKGEDRYLEIWATTPEAGEHEKAVQCFGLYRDITRSRKLQSRLRDKKTLESLGVLAGGIAHDFNNMLMSILGYAELLEVDLAGAVLAPAPRTRHGASHSIDEIKRAAKRASELCTSLLAYAGQHPVEKRDLNLAQLVRATTELMQVTTGKRVPIHLVTSAEPTISADAGQLTQVIMNLIGNAADAMQGYSGQIELEVGQQRIPPEDAPLANREMIGAGNEIACICVTDSGCGMTQKVQERMYEPFFTTKTEGRGLGMAAAHGIIANHNGSIHVTSAPNEGTQFRLYFPLRESNNAREISKASLPNSHEPNIPRVLVVDDEDNVREIVCEMLARLNCETTEAADAQQALLLAKAHSFDYALVDITMPGMSGAELARILLDAHPSLTIVLSSGYTQNELPQGLLERCPFIHKPYTLNEVANVLNLGYSHAPSKNPAID